MLDKYLTESSLLFFIEMVESVWFNLIMNRYVPILSAKREVGESPARSRRCEGVALSIPLRTGKVTMTLMPESEDLLILLMTY